MRKIVGEKKKTQRNRFTRMCMGDALVNIMQQKAPPGITGLRMHLKGRY